MEMNFFALSVGGGVAGLAPVCQERRTQTTYPELHIRETGCTVKGDRLLINTI